METIGPKNVFALLDAMGETFSIETVDDRKYLQKLVYLAQYLGLPKLYRFSWYVRGPYSPRLTQDYYELASDPDLREGAKLRAEFQMPVKRLKWAIESKPAAASKDDWAELLASIAFLSTESAYSWDEVASTIRKKKPHVASWLNEAQEILSEAETKKVV